MSRGPWGCQGVDIKILALVKNTELFFLWYDAYFLFLKNYKLKNAGLSCVFIFPLKKEF